MGTGEGNQVFGWGSYFTSVKGIAEEYANRLRPSNALFGGKTIEEARETFDSPVFSWIEHYVADGLNHEQVVAKLEDQLKDKEWLSKNTWVEPQIRKTLDFLKNNEVTKAKGNSNVYSVTLHKGKTPDQYTWLEWDKPVPQSVLDTVGRKLVSNGKELKDLFDNSREYTKTDGTVVKGLYPDGLIFYKRISQILGGDKEASLFLLKNGIDGIKYPAESLSRGATSDNARGFNYVVFDENAITIDNHVQFLRTAQGEVKGYVTPDGHVFIDPKFVDSNTPVHEFGHLWNTHIKENNPELWAKGRELVKGSPEWDRIKNSKEYAHLKGDEDKIADEVLATLYGEEGQNRMAGKDKGVLQNIKDWVAEAWNNLKQVFGKGNPDILKMTPDQISKLSLEEFIGKAVDNITDGKQIERNKGQNNTDGVQYEITLPDGTKKPVRTVNAEVVNGFYSPIENAITIDNHVQFLRTAQGKLILPSVNMLPRWGVVWINY